ncbi:MAG: hypothetical protein OEM52_14615, partial [bacterium]|nr:hypothetical protein [bacterium]
HQPQRQQRRESPAPTVPLQRPESSRYMGGGPRGPQSATSGEGAIRARLGSQDRPVESSRDRNREDAPQSRPNPRDNQRSDNQRPDNRRPDTRNFRPRDDDDTSLDALKRKVGELTPTDRKVLSYLISKKKIARNLNEQLEKNTLLAEKTLEFLGSWPIVIIMLIAWIIAFGYFLFGSQENREMLMMIFFGLGVVWASLVVIGLKARVVRDRERATLDYEQQLKLELDVRALRDRIETDIAPRIPEIVHLLKKLSDKPK